MGKRECASEAPNCKLSLTALEVLTFIYILNLFS
jgi:hypothetical protein